MMAQESLALAALKAKTQKKAEDEPAEKPMSLGALAAAQKKPATEPAKKYTMHGDAKPAKAAPKASVPEHGDPAPNQTADLGDKAYVWDSTKREYVPKSKLSPRK
jgi:hypothetical protein